MEKRDEERREREVNKACTQKALLELLAKVFVMKVVVCLHDAIHFGTHTKLCLF